MEWKTENIKDERKPLLEYPDFLMELCNCFISINKRPPNFFYTVVRGSIRSSASTSNGHETTRVKLAEELQRETERTLEWQSVCLQVSNFTSTSMGLAIARNGNLPFGRSREESQRLLNQTTAALLLPRPLNFSGIEDISDIVSSSVLRQLRTINELCAVKTTLQSAWELYQQLKEFSLDGDSIDRYSPLLEILENCDFVTDLEQKIEFCIDCDLSVILDRASEDLEIIRLERKRNMENLESLLKEVSTKIFQAGGIDTPLVTERRSRMCVGVRASHKFLLQDGVVLDISSSGATYFMEPREAVELNNMEVRLSSSENDEKLAILSLLTSEIAESERKIKYLLERILEVDLAFARASYAQWINGVCPILGPEGSDGSEPNKTENSLSVDIEGIQHPLLLESSLRSLSTDTVLESGSSIGLDRGNRAMDPGRLSEGGSDFPVPIDIKVGHTIKVVVISGPNTGGKTASMKTLGLASLMSKAGMYLPAKNYPRLPWFDLVLADIGDHQSLEQNLSTFSGHILRICKILEVTSKQSLVLIDEIGNGTDPSEGVALSASILQYLKDRVNLAVVTTHYADLSSLKDKDPQFENAAMEFCLETLKPTYRLLWGSKGDSNALSIAKSIGFDKKVLDRAQKWLERLKPNNQTDRKALLYQSLMTDKSMLEARARRAASLHSEIMELYHEIQGEAEDLDRRLVALKAKETLKVRNEVKAAKSQIDAVVQNFENQLRSASPDELNILIRKSEATIASIVEDHCRSNGFTIEETNSSYIPQIGEQVHVMGLGDKLATVVEAPGDDGTILVQYGKMRVRVKQSSVKAPPSRETTSSATQRKRQGQPHRTYRETTAEAINGEGFSYGPVVQTSKNTLDLRGMRVDEASRHLNMAIAASRSRTVLFVIHGMGTGVVKEQTLEILRNHPRIAKFEQESPMNYGCTIAYIK